MQGFLYGEGMTEKRKSGKKLIVLTDEQIQQIEKLSAYLTAEQMADYLGIGRQTLYDIMKRQPEVKVNYRKGKTKAIAGVANSLVQKALNGDTSSMIFYLKTQAGWKEKQEIDVSSSDGTMSPWSSITAGVSGKDES